MVDFKESTRPLTHFYQFAIDSPEVGIGSTQHLETNYLELYEKSLALASDLERLPILVGARAHVEGAAPMKAYMVAAGLSGIACHIDVVNEETDEGDEADNDDIVVRASASFWSPVAASTLSNMGSDFTWDFEGGILLAATISLIAITNTDIAVAGAAFAAGAFTIYVTLEVDWVKVTQKELDQFIREFLYARKGT